MPKTIKTTLSTESLKAAIEELREYKRFVQRKTEALNERLANIALHEADERFSTAQYDGENDVRLVAEPTKNGWAITAHGQAVCFIEFGAGVHYNGDGSGYPLPKPDGIVGIGEYGHGWGKRDVWYFKTPDDDTVRTHGNPAAMPMFFATEAVRNAVYQVAKEVFGAND